MAAFLDHESRMCRVSRPIVNTSAQHFACVLALVVELIGRGQTSQFGQLTFEQGSNCSAPQLVLALEMIFYQCVVGTCTGGNCPRRCAIKAFFRKLL